MLWQKRKANKVNLDNKLSYKGRKNFDFSGQKKLNLNELQESISRLTMLKADSRKRFNHMSPTKAYPAPTKHNYNDDYFKKKLKRANSTYIGNL